MVLASTSKAHEILFDKLLKDVKDYIPSGPRQIDWQKANINDIGSRLVDQNEQQYVGRTRRAVGPRSRSRSLATSTGG